MKKTVSFLSFLVLLTLFFFFPFSSAIASYNYTPLESIPGFGKTADFPTFVLNFYKFGIWAVGIAALFMLTVGGFMYMTSSGNMAKNDSAKTVIWDSIIGLVLALAAYLILYIINPDLVKINVGMKGSTTSTTAPTAQTPTTSTDMPKCNASVNSAATSQVLECVNGKVDNSQLGSVKTFDGSHTCNLSVSPPSISCHYGGRDCNGQANAIDYGGPSGAGGGKTYADIVSAAKSCGVAIARCEDGDGKTHSNCYDKLVDHVHVTVSGNCGCS